MIHFHPHKRLTVTLGVRPRFLPVLCFHRMGRVSSGGFYGSWLGLYVEYNHTNGAWRRFRLANA